MVIASTAQVTPFATYAEDKMKLRYSHVVSGRYETWTDIARRVVHSLCRDTAVTPYMIVPNDIQAAMVDMICQRKFIPGGRILSQAGRPYHQTDNCYTLRAADSREGWADLAHKCTMMFMSGGGVGVDYSDVRAYGRPLSRSGGIASGPLPLLEMVNSIAAASRAGGERRGACYASLKYDHDDIHDFIQMKEVVGALQHTNISVRFDTQFTADMSHDNACKEVPATSVFMETLRHACQYGDPGFQFDWDDQVLRNACTEIISNKDSDSCCIGSVNLAAISSLQELSDVTNLGILFLLCNTLYTDFPTDMVEKVKGQNRRLGLGLMGIAEWFMQRSLPYGDRAGAQDSIGQWLHTWQQNCDNAALHWSNKLSVNTPVATRAIAPTGTISIMGHTTPGIEPIFHTAYQRTTNTLKTKDYADGYKREVVIDPIVSKWLSEGYNVEDIDTAYTLSQSVSGIERRLAFQAYVQTFVDNAISSTVNLPPYTDGVETTFAPILLRYLPHLRGVTFYPDGRHSNQPVTPIDIADIDMFQQTLDQGPTCSSGECGL
jgi:ribonucleoside-diphosphate reductase alpha chain